MKWSVHHTNEYLVYSSPTVDSRGTIYISDDYFTYAINPNDGSLRWRTDTGALIGSEYSSVVIGPDGTLYIGSEDMDRLIALQETNRPPVAQIAVSPTNPVVGLAISLDGSGSSDPDTNDEIETYEWDLTSRPSESEAEISDSTQAVASLVPDVPGDFVITLRVADTYGLENTLETTVAVGAGAPAAPGNVEASDGSYDDYVQITWDASEGATEYQIYRGRGSCEDFPFDEIAVVTDLHYEDSDINAAEVHWYKVRACKDSTCSDFSECDPGYCGTPVSIGPGGFRVDAQGNVYSAGSVHGKCFGIGSADIAEWVDVSELVEPGDVLLLDPLHPMAYRRSIIACSQTVAGVVSTSPGLALGEPIASSEKALLALVGIVPVKVTNEGGPIQPGDLLVTSSTPGHAMRWAGPDPCPCALVGKALEPMADEAGMILVLLTAH